MRINQNISAMNTYSRLNSANNAKAGSLAKLSSGLRINRAGDDAAGLAISEKMRGQVGGLKQSIRNAQDGISLIQTAEGGLSETHSILNRMRELAVQSSNDTNTDVDRSEIQKEMNQLSTEISRIGSDTQFNTQELLDGSYKGKKFHIGANSEQSTTIDINDMGAKALGVQGDAYSTTISGVTIISQDNTQEVAFVAATDSGIATSAKMSGDVAVVTIGVGTTLSKAEDIKTALEGLKEAKLTVSFASGTSGGSKLTAAAVTAAAAISTADSEASKSFGIDVSSQTAADAAITTIDKAIESVSAERSKLGATQNRLDHTINNLTATAENLSEAESRIRDVDMAEEMMSFTKNNILSQAATSMLAQANQMPQSVLQLLQ